jgi:ornithine lipid hydroxylase
MTFRVLLSMKTQLSFLSCLPYVAFPATMLLSGGLIRFFLFLGANFAMCMGVVSVIHFGIVCLWERVIPYRAEWNKPDGETANDWGHLFLGSVFGGYLGNELVQLALSLAMLAFFFSQESSGLWPKGLPFPLSILLVFLIADLGRYLQHRWHHTFSWAWNFHVLHHLTDRLWALKSSRSQFVERILQQVSLFLPLTLLGAPQDAVFVFIAFNSLLGPFSHCNADIRLGFMNRVLMGPEVHRIHHGKIPNYGTKNYGSATVVWDLVFGTYLDPNKVPKQFEVGLEQDAQPQLKGFFRQLSFPFLRGDSK